APGQAPYAQTTSTLMPYQGTLSDAGGNPVTGNIDMIFRFYNLSTGGAALWQESHSGANAVPVENGLFQVMLGSLTPIPQSLMTDSSNLWLGITVGTDDEMAPREQLGSVPFAVQAHTVPDGSITSAKISDGAVTGDKLSLPYWDIRDNSATYWLTTATGQYVEVPNMGFSFTPARNGVVLLNLTTALMHSAVNANLNCAIAVNGSVITVGTIYTTSQEQESCATNMAYPVTAGTPYHFALQVYSNTAGTLSVHLKGFTDMAAFYAASAP
ncbi:MAG: hypothetical protein WCC12_14235, partial [Anaerolineales bacterium]